MESLFNGTNQLPFPAELIPFIIVWSLIWKGFALWKAARQEQNYWFIALLILNTMGILEIAYLFYFSKLIKSSISKKNGD